MLMQLATSPLPKTNHNGTMEGKMWPLMKEWTAVSTYIPVVLIATQLQFLTGHTAAMKIILKAIINIVFKTFTEPTSINHGALMVTIKAEFQ